MLVVLGGCQLIEKRLEKEIFTENLELTMDRPADLRPPEGLRVTSSEDREIDLAWNPVLVGDVSGYAVLRSQDAKTGFALIGRTSSRFGTVFRDRGIGEEQLGDGQIYFYRVHPYDRTGRVSRSHAYTSATTEARPDTPRGLRTFSNLPRIVVIVWDPNERRSTTGYTVQRSPTVAGRWEQVGFAEGRLNTVYEDSVPGDLRVMYYRVVATNRFAGRSDATEPVRAVTKAEPLPPIGLEVTGLRLGEVELSWTPNVERDLARYEVWRQVRNGDGWTEPQRIGEVATPKTRFEDPEVGCGQLLRYSLRGVDGDGLHSGFSLPLEVSGGTIGLRLVSEGGVTRLVWDREQAAGWPAARVIYERGFGPARELGSVTNANSVDLGELGPGTHQLAVILTTTLPEGASGDDRDAPRCEITVELPRPPVK